MTSDDRLRLIRYVATAPTNDLVLAKLMTILESADNGGATIPSNPAWLNSRDAMAYVSLGSMASWYDWRRRHAIVGRLVARADLDRALKADVRRKRRMHPVSLANLRHGRPQEG